MKIQDIVFIIVFLALFLRRDARFFAIAGLGSLLLAIPLFGGWVFFTAQRLVWYAAAFLLLSIILHIVDFKEKG